MAERRRARRTPSRERPRPKPAGGTTRRQLAEALERERALGDILRVINASPAAAGPVFEAILDHALRLCASPVGILFLYDGDAFRLVAQRGAAPAFVEPRLQAHRTGPHTGLGRAVRERRPVQIRDLLADRAYLEADPARLETVKLLRARTGVWVPLLREGVPVGVICVWRQEVRAFTPEQIGLLAAFASQAVIAIENARLFQTLDARNRELTDALERETATGAILRVISGSPTDVQPVFDAIVSSAVRLCGAFNGALFRLQDGLLDVAAYSGTTTRDWAEVLRAGFPKPPARDLVGGVALLDRVVVHIPDIERDDRFPRARELARMMGYRSILFVPMLRDEEPIGTIGLNKHTPFSDGQIELLKTFAHQAVIAIENVRLVRELQGRNRELTESLEQQTATAEILRVISSSPTDLTPVMQAVATSAARLCEATDAVVRRVVGEYLEPVAVFGPLPTQRLPIRRGIPSGRAVLDGQPVHVHDVVEVRESEFPDVPPSAFELGFRTALAVPMLREGTAIGVISIRRQEVKPFSETQVALLQTFAAQAVIAIENVRLFQELQARNRELTEALEQQTATSEILRVISASPTDVQPVFEAVVVSAARLCEATDVSLYRAEGDVMRNVAMQGISGLAPGDTRPITPRSVSGRAILTGQTIHIHDFLSEGAHEYPDGWVGAVERHGIRTVLVVPLLWEGTAIGALVIRRMAVRPFSAAQIELVQTFAAQAVIAIENVRLFQELQTRNRELTDALEQQTATAEVLQAISGSPTDVQPVFDTIVQRAVRLCEGAFGAAYQTDGERLYLVAHANFTPEGLEALRRAYPRPVDDATPSGRAILGRTVVHVPDVAAEYGPDVVQPLRVIGVRSQIAVPMLREGVPIGAIAVGRREVGSFSEKRIALLRTFAAQAVIAIENVRLFQELQARNRELTESLEQQTATSEILGVISSSPTDLQPVFDAIVRNASRLCDGHWAIAVRFDGEMLHLAAQHGARGGLTDVVPRLFPRRPGRELSTGRAVLERAPVHIPDVEADPDFDQEAARAQGMRSVITVPMMRDRVPIDAFGVSRATPGPFGPRHIELLKTFADQAVIAIENVRLFQELQARNRELTEALEQQTATSEVLKVISRSTFDLDPVLATLIENAARLCAAEKGFIWRLQGESYVLAADYGATPEFRDFMRRNPIRPGRATLVGRIALERRPVHVPDVLDDAEYDWTAAQQLGGFRTLLGVPMLRGGAPIGVIGLWREQARPFSERQAELLATFADQAVIAIENVRLFQELRARTQELARSVEELRALGEVGQAVNSTLDVDTVLTTIVARAVELSATDGGAIYEFDEGGQEFLLRATHGMSAELIEAVRETRIRAGETPVGRAAAARRPVQVPDILGEPPYPLREAALKAGFRAFLAVPLVREELVVGALVVRRRTPGEFPDATVNLLQTFAAQSVLAIQNARLFRELEEKSRQLEVASRHKSQFLANMSHELRTPLNAILGYTELILDSIYGEIPGRAREVMERIDKSGRHLLGLINDVLDLSKIEAGQLALTLADYSLRDVVQTVAIAVEALAAEKQLALKVVVASDLPRGRGDERRIAQVLLNLVGNAIKFTEAGEVRVEATAGDGRFVVAVSDTGPGIAQADQQRIFEEFQQADTSTTRKKGGTGLGLSIARRIVELHGGAIRVDSAPGRGSIFTFTVPVRVERQAAPTA